MRSQSTQVLPCTSTHKTEGRIIRVTFAEGSGCIDPSQLSLELNPSVGSQNLHLVLYPFNCLVLILRINYWVLIMDTVIWTGRKAPHPNGVGFLSRSMQPCSLLPTLLGPVTKPMGEKLRTAASRRRAVPRDHRDGIWNKVISMYCSKILPIHLSRGDSQLPSFHRERQNVTPFQKHHGAVIWRLMSSWSIVLVKQPLLVGEK